jgi:hypothetical protein
MKMGSEMVEVGRCDENWKERPVWSEAVASYGPKGFDNIKKSGVLSED